MWNCTNLPLKAPKLPDFLVLRQSQPMARVKSARCENRFRKPTPALDNLHKRRQKRAENINVHPSPRIRKVDYKSA